MSTPHTTETPLRLQAVEHDPFIDDLERPQVLRSTLDRPSAETSQPSR